MPCFIKPDMHHTCLRIVPWLCDVCLLCCLLSFRCTSSRYSGNVAFVRIRWLRPFIFFMDSFFFLAGFQARWPYPRNHFYLCLLDARSFAMPMLRYLPLSYHASHIVNQASNPPCPRKPLFGYVTALLSPSYSVVSCRWRLEFVPCWNMNIVGISQYFLFN